MGQSTWDVMGDANCLILAPFVPFHCPLSLRADKLPIKIPRLLCIPTARPRSHQTPTVTIARSLRFNASRAKLAAYKRHQYNQPVSISPCVPPSIIITP